MTFPCPKCGARADIDCGHRLFDPEWKLPERKKGAQRGGDRGGGLYKVDPAKYKPKRGDGAGMNFKTRKRPK